MRVFLVRAEPKGINDELQDSRTGRPRSAGGSGKFMFTFHFFCLAFSFTLHVAARNVVRKRCEVLVCSGGGGLQYVVAECRKPERRKGEDEREHGLFWLSQDFRCFLKSLNLETKNRPRLSLSSRRCSKKKKRQRPPSRALARRAHSS